VSLAITLLVFGAAVALMATSRRRRQAARARADIQADLDPATASWLRRRDRRRADAKVSASAGRIVATSNLQPRPSGLQRVRAAFDYTAAARREYGVVVAADAYGGPAETVAMAAMPSSMVRLWEPGMEPVDDELCPPGWSLAIELGDPPPAPDRYVVAALGRLTSPEASAPEELVAFVKFHRGRLRAHFTGDSVYVMIGTRRSRERTVQLAEFLALCLPTGPPPSA
jgi:hypothetical protein